jgi:ribose 5-phosphate isomerase B
MISNENLRPIVRELVADVLSKQVKTGSNSPPPAGKGAQLINSAEVMDARHAGILSVPKGAIVTPLARDTAERFGVKIVVGGKAILGTAKGPGSIHASGADPVPHSPAPYKIGGRIAIGADHGGFKLKERLIGFLRQKNRFEVVDKGCYDTGSVDYPDIASAVSQSVTMGDAAFGILVDGAGIGSCMAANKFPGVLAANCHSEGTARNSREHNGANVLCLGSGHLDTDQAISVLDAWLSTAFGGGRHGRRVAKIKEIEQGFMKSGGRS